MFSPLSWLILSGFKCNAAFSFSCSGVVKSDDFDLWLPVGGEPLLRNSSGNIKSTLKNMSRNVTIGRHKDSKETRVCYWPLQGKIQCRSELWRTGTQQGPVSPSRLDCGLWSHGLGGISPELPCVKLYAAVDSSACDYSNKGAVLLAVIMCFDGDVTRCSFSTNVPQREGTSRRVPTTWSSSELPVVCQHEAPWMRKKNCGDTFLPLQWAQHRSGIHVVLMMLLQKYVLISSTNTCTYNQLQVQNK